MLEGQYLIDSEVLSSMAAFQSLPSATRLLCRPDSEVLSSMIAMSKQCRLVIAWAVLIASGLWILVLGIYIIEWLNEWVGEIPKMRKMDS